MVKLISSYHNVTGKAQQAVVLIGNFDGLHRGHQALIKTARNLAQKQNLPVALMSFNPHPQQFFNPNLPPFSISTAAQKKRLLDHFGVDIWFQFSFDQDFSQLSPEEFMTQVLKHGICPSHIIVGPDFRFGYKRAGDANLLKKHCEKNNYQVTIHDSINTEENTIISSTIIREAIHSGDMKKAEYLLGWPWEIEGEVIHGDKRGRKLGYPTANMNLGPFIHPLYGIYAVEITFDQKALNPQWLSGMASIGKRPMFKTPTPLCETFIFDFDQEIYGQIIRVRPKYFLRPEKKFSHLDDLVSQMKIDEQRARHYIAS